MDNYVHAQYVHFYIILSVPKVTNITTCMCSNVGSVCRLQYQCSGMYIQDVRGIYVQGHMSIM